MEEVRVVMVRVAAMAGVKMVESGEWATAGERGEMARWLERMEVKMVSKEEVARVVVRVMAVEGEVSGARLVTTVMGEMTAVGERVGVVVVRVAAGRAVGVVVVVM